MDSPATSTAGTQRSRPQTHRKPLQPKNTPAAKPHTRSPLKPKPAPRPLQLVSPARGIAGTDDKENRLPGSAVLALAAGIAPLDTSLAEELGAVRQRREKLRKERDRTEEMLAERGRFLDRAMREVERRWEEQRRVELDLKRLIRRQAIGGGLSVQCSSPVQSLREREEKKKKKEAQTEKSSFQPLGEGEEKRKEDVQCQVIEEEGKESVPEESLSSLEGGGVIQELRKEIAPSSKSIDRLFEFLMGRVDS